MAYKTNVMRILDKMRVVYNSHSYANTDAISGIEVAKALNQDPNRVFKTLVTVGKTKNHYVFLVPVAAELDLKKAADSVGEKSIEMTQSHCLWLLQDTSWRMLPDWYEKNLSNYHS